MANPVFHFFFGKEEKSADTYENFVKNADAYDGRRQGMTRSSRGSKERSTYEERKSYHPRRDGFVEGGGGRGRGRGFNRGARRGVGRNGRGGVDVRRGFRGGYRGGFRGEFRGGYRGGFHGQFSDEGQRETSDGNHNETHREGRHDAEVQNGRSEENQNRDDDCLHGEINDEDKENSLTPKNRYTHKLKNKEEQIKMLRSENRKLVNELKKLQEVMRIHNSVEDNAEKADNDQMGEGDGVDAREKYFEDVGEQIGGFEYENESELGRTDFYVKTRGSTNGIGSNVPETPRNHKNCEHTNRGSRFKGASYIEKKFDVTLEPVVGFC